MKFISKNASEDRKGNVRVFIESGYLITISTSIILTGGLVFLSDYIAVQWYNEPDLGYLIRILSLAIIGRALLFGAYGVTVGFERMDLRGSLRIVYAFLKSVVSPCLVLLGLGTMGGILGEVGPVLVAGFIGLYFSYTLYKGYRGEKSDFTHMQTIRMILSFSLPLYFANLLTSTRTQLLTFLMGLYLGEEITGNWTIVMWFSSLLSFVNLPVRTTIFPLFSKISDQKELEYVYQNSVKFATLLTYPLAFTVMALSDQIIYSLFSNDYVYASSFLRLYMITFLFTGVGGSSNIPLLNSQMRTRETFVIQFIQFIITIPACLYIIPRYGAVGGIILFIIGIFVSKFYSVSKVWSIFNFSFHISSTVKMLSSGAVSSWITFYLYSRISLNSWIELLSGGVVSVILYVALIMILRVLDRSDLRRLRKLGGELGPLSNSFLFVLTLYERFYN